jgi:transcription antitermination protein NusB
LTPANPRDAAPPSGAANAAKPFSREARSRARRAALQALYQWQITRQPVGEVVVQFLEDPEAGRFDVEYFRQLVGGVETELDAVDELLAPFLDRPVAQVDPIERAALRLGAYELRCCPEVPWRVVINEAVSLARSFGAEGGHRYVNGVLDRVARITRPIETGPPAPASD